MQHTVFPVSEATRQNERRLEVCSYGRISRAADVDPLLLDAPFVVELATVLSEGKERPSLTVGHAPVLLATTGPKDADLPALYWLGSPLALATPAPCQLSHSGPGRPFIKALMAAEQRGVLCLDDRM